MKIAYIYDAVYPWEKGGAQKRVWELARRLADRHDVHLYGLHYWAGPSVIEREGVTLHGVCEPMELYVDGRRSIREALRFGRKVLRPLFREEFDVVDCQEFPYFPVFSSKLHELLGKSELVVTWYEWWGDYWYEYLGWKGVFGKAVERAALRVPSEVVPISNKIRRDIERAGRKKGITVVHNGVDYHGIQEVEAADDSWDAIYVGRLAEHKNVDLLLEAVAMISEEFGEDISCCVVGDGPEREKLEDKVRELGVDGHVSFLGFVESHDDVISHMKSARVFVLPSTREGFPNTILEANACGLPSIVIDHPENGGTEVVEHGETGFVTELSPEAVGKHLYRMLEDDAEKERMSEAALMFAEEHDWSVIAEQLEQVYLKVIR